MDKLRTFYIHVTTIFWVSDRTYWNSEEPSSPPEAVQIVNIMDVVLALVIKQDEPHNMHRYRFFSSKTQTLTGIRLPLCL